jgi:hypothetical protein
VSASALLHTAKRIFGLSCLYPLPGLVVADGGGEIESRSGGCGRRTSRSRSTPCCRRVAFNRSSQSAGLHTLSMIFLSSQLLISSLNRSGGKTMGRRMALLLA